MNTKKWYLFHVWQESYFRLLAAHIPIMFYGSKRIKFTETKQHTLIHTHTQNYTLKYTFRNDDKSPLACIRYFQLVEFYWVVSIAKAYKTNDWSSDTKQKWCICLAKMCCFVDLFNYWSSEIVCLYKCSPLFSFSFSLPLSTLLLPLSLPVHFIRFIGNQISIFVVWDNKSDTHSNWNHISE